MFVKSNFFKNVVTGFCGQLIALILGLIVPRLIITSYGSDINGLLSTVTQVFTYMALLEAGIGSAARNAIFKYINEKNNSKINSILSSAESYFRKLSYLYLSGVIIFAFILPFVIKSDVNYWTIFMLTIFEGLASAISFCFVQTPTIFLSAFGKNYVNNNITLLNKIISYSSKIVMAYFGINIVLLQLVYFLISIAKAIFYRIYLKKNYSWINLNEKSDFKLKDRNSYLISEITWTIFSSTDMIVLSIFLNTKIASIYGIYNMVFASLNVLLNAVYNSVTYKLGQIYHSNIEKYKILHDLYNSLFLGVMTILMAVSYILVLPFVSLYTYGVSDTNYIIKELPLLFCLVQILSWSRYVGGNLIGISGRQRQAVKINVIEAVINLSLSILLVSKFGIVGVLFATVIALPVKLVYCNFVADKIILKRSMKNTIKILSINYIIFIGSILASEYIQLKIENYFQFLLYGILITFIISIIAFILNSIVNPNILTSIKQIKKKESF